MQELGMVARKIHKYRTKIISVIVYVRDFYKRSFFSERFEPYSPKNGTSDHGDFECFFSLLKSRRIIVT